MNETLLEDPKQFFYLVNGQLIRHIKQLIELVPLLSEEEYRHHVYDGHNDFYNWIKNVFEDIETADLIKACSTRDEFQERLYTYLADQEARKKEQVKEKLFVTQKELFKKDPSRFAHFRQQESRFKEKESERFDAAAKRITEKAKTSILPLMITRLDALREREKELRGFITATRKEGRDVLLPDLVLRQFPAKAEFAKLTGEEFDIDRAEAVLNVAEQELGDVVMKTAVDPRHEVELLVRALEQEDRKAKKAA